jgi:large subunit ribosomal protein L22
MEARASSQYVRLSAQKARLLLGLIRGQAVERALGILEFTARRGAKVVAKTLRSAVANAESGQRVDVDLLYVKRAFADEGPTLKRFLPRAHGRATKLFKRTSHITVVVDERHKPREA